MTIKSKIQKMNSKLDIKIIRDSISNKVDKNGKLSNTKFMTLSDTEIKKLFDMSFNANFDTDKYISGVVIDTHTLSIEKIVNKLIDLFADPNAKHMDEIIEENNGAINSEIVEENNGDVISGMTGDRAIRSGGGRVIRRGGGSGRVIRRGGGRGSIGRGCIGRGGGRGRIGRGGVCVIGRGGGRGRGRGRIISGMVGDGEIEVDVNGHESKSSYSDAPFEEKLLLEIQPVLHKLKAKLCIGFYVSDFKPVSDYEFKAKNMSYKLLSINQQIDFVKSSHAEEIKFANGHFLTNIKVSVSGDINGTATIKQTFVTHDKNWHKQIYEKIIVLENAGPKNNPEPTKFISVECTKNQFLQVLSFNANGNILDEIVPTMTYTATCSTAPGVGTSKRSDAILSYKIPPELSEILSSLVVVPAKNDTPEKAEESAAKKQYIKGVENIYLFLLILIVMLFFVYSNMDGETESSDDNESTSNWYL
jgi:hypothetical protein